MFETLCALDRPEHIFFLGDRTWSNHWCIKFTHSCHVKIQNFCNFFGKYICNCHYICLKILKYINFILCFLSLLDFPDFVVLVQLSDNFWYFSAYLPNYSSSIQSFTLFSYSYAYSSIFSCQRTYEVCTVDYRWIQFLPKTWISVSESSNYGS